jgi:choline dehydrogenase-like flavoprotein
MSRFFQFFLQYFNFLLKCYLLHLSYVLQVIHKYYDFIVIGSGSAGAVVANRLSEQPNWNILLLEAGGDEPTISDVPVLAAYLQLSDIDWQYKTEPQPTACLGFNDKK